jgi:hypothetical protein
MEEGHAPVTRDKVSIEVHDEPRAPSLVMRNEYETIGPTCGRGCRFGATSAVSNVKSDGGFHVSVSGPTPVHYELGASELNDSGFFPAPAGGLSGSWRCWIRRQHRQALSFFDR